MKKIEITKSLVLFNSLSQKLQRLPFTIFQGRYLAHIIDQNEHLKIFKTIFTNKFSKQHFHKNLR